MPPFKHFCLPWTNGKGNNALCIIGLGCNCELSIEDVQKLLNEADLEGRFEVLSSECSY